jgi:hypothetical protein
MTNLLKVFMAGVISPLYGIIITLMIFVCTQIILVTKNITPNNSFSNGLWFSADNGLYFLGIFALVMTLIMIFTDIGESYINPSSGIVKISGTIIGTLLFWGSLMQISKIIGSSEVDIILSFILAVIAPIFGIYLRYKLHSHRTVIDENY